MAHLNRIEIIGNLGRDAEVKPQGEQNIISFSVGCTEKYTDKAGQQQSRTTWFNCDLWRKQTGISQYLKKGQQVWLEGEMLCRQYKDKQGNDRDAWSIRVDRLELLGSGKQGAVNDLVNTFGLKQSNEPF